MTVARAQKADELHRNFLRSRGVTPVATGRFGAHMQVDLCNDGPVTVWLDSRAIGASQ